MSLEIILLAKLAALEAKVNSGGGSDGSSDGGLPIVKLETAYPDTLSGGAYEPVTLTAEESASLTVAANTGKPAIISFNLANVENMTAVATLGGGDGHVTYYVPYGPIGCIFTKKSDTEWVGAE